MRQKDSLTRKKQDKLTARYFNDHLRPLSHLLKASSKCFPAKSLKGIRKE